MCVVHRSYWIANREWLWSPLVEGVITFGWLALYNPVQPLYNPTILFLKQIGYYSLFMHWMNDKSGPPHSPDTESWRRNWKNPCMTCTTRFYMWRCSSNVLDHLLLGIIFPLSFTSHPLDLLSRWVLRLQIQRCTGHVSSAMTLPFPSAWKRIRMSSWESRVPLRMAGAEKAWNTGVACLWTG